MNNTHVYGTIGFLVVKTNQSDERLRQIVEVMYTDLPEFDENAARAKICGIRNSYTHEKHDLQTNFNRNISKQHI